MAELGEKTGLQWSSLYHHIKKLQGVGLVRSMRVKGHRIVFPAGVRTHSAMVKANAGAALFRGTARRVAQAIHDKPGRGVKELMAELGLSQRVTYHHVSNLRNAGLVTSDGTSRSIGLRSTKKLDALFAPSGKRADGVSTP